VNKSVSVRRMAVRRLQLSQLKKAAGDPEWSTGNYISVQ